MNNNIDIHCDVERPKYIPRILSPLKNSKEKRIIA